MPNEEKQKVLEIHGNDSLPTVFVDNMVITSRTDGHLFVRFCTMLPEGLKEQTRMMVPRNAMEKIIDVLCKNCDYYPTKEKQVEQKKLKLSQFQKGKKQTSN